MKVGIKKPVPLQRDLTVTKLEAIEDRATGTWHFRFRFLDQSRKVRTMIVPGDVAAQVSKLLPELHKAGARLPPGAAETKRVVNAAIASRAYEHRSLRPTAGMAGRQRRDPSDPRMETRSSAPRLRILC